jgi:uncharacterized protein (DUF433 family)
MSKLRAIIRSMAILDRITINPDICLGQPSIRGMRITASVILKMLASGRTREEILRAYSELEPEDIDQVLLYAAWLASEQSVPFPAA